VVSAEFLDREKKTYGARSGENRGWRITVMWFLARKSTVSIVVEKLINPHCTVFHNVLAISLWISQKICIEMLIPTFPCGINFWCTNSIFVENNDISIKPLQQKSYNFFNSTTHSNS
jgi:hypothetical protein